MKGCDCALYWLLGNKIYTGFICLHAPLPTARGHAYIWKEIGCIKNRPGVFPVKLYKPASLCFIRVMLHRIFYAQLAFYVHSKREQCLCKCTFIHVCFCLLKLSFLCILRLPRNSKQVQRGQLIFSAILNVQGMYMALWSGLKAYNFEKCKVSIFLCFYFFW